MRTLLLLALLLLLSGCGWFTKDEPNPDPLSQLPPATQVVEFYGLFHSYSITKYSNYGN
ncbi:MAG: hypothetical protein WBA12_08160 [Catalinimonas sp.]